MPGPSEKGFDAGKHFGEIGGVGHTVIGALAKHSANIARPFEPYEHRRPFKYRDCPALLDRAGARSQHQEINRQVRLETSTKARFIQGPAELAGASGVRVDQQ